MGKVTTDKMHVFIKSNRFIGYVKRKNTLRSDALVLVE